MLATEYPTYGEIMNEEPMGAESKSKPRFQFSLLMILKFTAYVAFATVLLVNVFRLPPSARPIMLLVGILLVLLTVLPNIIDWIFGVNRKE